METALSRQLTAKNRFHPSNARVPEDLPAPGRGRSLANLCGAVKNYKNTKFSWAAGRMPVPELSG